MSGRLAGDFGVWQSNCNYEGMKPKKKQAPGTQVRVGGLSTWICGDVAMPLANTTSDVKEWLKIFDGPKSTS